MKRIVDGGFGLHLVTIVSMFISAIVTISLTGSGFSDIQFTMLFILLVLNLVLSGVGLLLFKTMNYSRLILYWRVLLIFSTITYYLLFLRYMEKSCFNGAVLSNLTIVVCLILFPVFLIRFFKKSQNKVQEMIRCGKLSSNLKELVIGIPFYRNYEKPNTTFNIKIFIPLMFICTYFIFPFMEKYHHNLFWFLGLVLGYVSLLLPLILLYLTVVELIYFQFCMAK